MQYADITFWIAIYYCDKSFAYTCMDISTTFMKKLNIYSTASGTRLCKDSVKSLHSHSCNRIFCKRRSYSMKVKSRQGFPFLTSEINCRCLTSCPSCLPPREIVPACTELGAVWALKPVCMLWEIQCVFYSTYQVSEQLLIYEKINEVQL